MKGSDGDAITSMNMPAMVSVHLPNFKMDGTQRRFHNPLWFGFKKKKASFDKRWDSSRHWNLTTFDHSFQLLQRTSDLAMWLMRRKTHVHSFCSLHVKEHFWQHHLKTRLNNMTWQLCFTSKMSPTLFCEILDVQTIINLCNKNMTSVFIPDWVFVLMILCLSGIACLLVLNILSLETTLLTKSVMLFDVVKEDTDEHWASGRMDDTNKFHDSDTLRLIIYFMSVQHYWFYLWGWVRGFFSCVDQGRIAIGQWWFFVKQLSCTSSTKK